MWGDISSWFDNRYSLLVFHCFFFSRSIIERHLGHRRKSLLRAFLRTFFLLAFGRWNGPCTKSTSPRSVLSASFFRPSASCCIRCVFFLLRLVRRQKRFFHCCFLLLSFLRARPCTPIFGSPIGRRLTPTRRKNATSTWAFTAPSAQANVRPRKNT